MWKQLMELARSYHLVQAARRYIARAAEQEGAVKGYFVDGKGGRIKVEVRPKAEMEKVVAIVERQGFRVATKAEWLAAAEQGESDE